MDKYYVDSRVREVIKNLDTTFLAPELYYEYGVSSLEGIIREVWFVGDGKQIDFCVSVDEPKKELARKLHFERHNVKPLYLIRYEVPEEWFNEIIEQCK